MKSGSTQSTYDRVMVTGGTGFIGSHTVDALLRNGSKVWVLDNLSSSSLRNLKQWKHDPGLFFRKGDVTDYKTVRLFARKVEAIIHLAAIVSPDLSIGNPELVNGVNVTGTLNILRAARESHVDRVVFASSSSVYGNPPSTPVSESSGLNPITPYGASKLAAEKYCKAFHETYGLSTVSLRYFNVYGERQRSNPYSGVIAIFVRRILKRLPTIIYGDGNQTRDFINVSDVVAANLTALRTQKGVGEAFNIGTGQPTTINQLFRLIVQIAGKRGISPTHREFRRGDIRASWCKTRKTRHTLGFEPKVSLRYGLKHLIECSLSHHQRAL